MTDVPARFTTLAVLAGGAGARMGGPKASMTLDGRPILERLLGQLAWPGPTLLVTALGRERPPGHDRFDAEAIDDVAGEGPLRGLLTAMEAATTSLLVIVPVDMPNLEAFALRWLLDRLVQRPVRAGVMISQNDRVEPMPAAFRVAPARALARQLLAEGVRALHALAGDESIDVIQCPTEWPAAMWLNLNRPIDVEAFHAVARGSIA